MSLHHDFQTVHAIPDADDDGGPMPAPGLDLETCPDALDLVELFGLGPDPDPAEHTDRAWLLDEARAYEDRGRGRLRYSVEGLAAGALRDVVRSMRFHRHDSARAFVADPAVPFGPSDLDAVRLPSLSSGSELAAALATEASWYLQLDTDAGRLAAWHLLYHAAQAEEWGSRTALEYRDDEAAWRQAMMAAAAEAGAEW